MKNSSNKYILICLCLFLFLSYFLYRKFRLGDDTYIYLQYAKNIINYAEISFNIGEKSYGFTSPFWLLLVVALGIILKNILVIPVMLSLCFSLLTLIIWFLIIKRLFEEKKLIFWALLIIALDPNLQKHAFLGMEAPLAYFLSSVLIYLIILFQENKKPFLILSITMGIYLLVRPESIFVSFIIILYLLLSRIINIKDFVKIGSLVLLIVGPWYLFSFIYFNSIFPSTFAAKGGTSEHGSKMLIHLKDSFIIILANYFMFLVIPISLKIKQCKIKISKNENKLIYLFSFLTVIMLLFYSLTLNREQIYARYLCMLFPFLLYTAIIHLKIIELNRTIPIIICSLFIVNIFNSYTTTIIFMNGENEENSIISWVLENTRKDEMIVRGRIGKIAYYTDRKILDPVGIINPEIIPYYRNNKVQEYFKKKKPSIYIGEKKYLMNNINSDSFNSELTIHHNYSFTVRRLFQDPRGWEENIYRLSWEK